MYHPTSMTGLNPRVYRELTQAFFEFLVRLWNDSFLHSEFLRRAPHFSSIAEAGIHFTSPQVRDCLLTKLSQQLLSLCSQKKSNSNSNHENLLTCVVLIHLITLAMIMIPIAVPWRTHWIVTISILLHHSTIVSDRDDKPRLLLLNLFGITITTMILELAAARQEDQRPSLARY